MKRIGFVFIIAIAAVSCNNKKKDAPDKLVTEQPRFTKEGELTFYKPDQSKLTAINIEIAETEAEQQQGLMNRPFMREDQGMLFIFEGDAPRSFWMHNTIIPLDIIYVNAAGEIVHIAENTEPFSDAPIPSGRPAKYVVEVNAGFSAQYGLTEGGRISYVKN